MRKLRELRRKLLLYLLRSASTHSWISWCTSSTNGRLGSILRRKQKESGSLPASEGSERRWVFASSRLIGLRNLSLRMAEFLRVGYSATRLMECSNS
ncbi:hypothetical protein MA16_Dca013432 [Dendrobium catenatum]|uniref:Uncharacterized protein n=1 Tax=Dendrobium catenatum TaxID=906689 RepID=A0A2I0X2W2_9ASPA|nr:hypothetical protein MA16_Dca013432 [Dendrobium catenatum]